MPAPRAFSNLPPPTSNLHLSARPHPPYTTRTPPIGAPRHGWTRHRSRRRERLGRFHRLARSGFNVLIPFFERPRSIDVRFFEADVSGVKRISAGSTTRIDLREQVLNFPSQPVITKDNVTIDIDAVLYYRVADPQKATYAVQNLPYALETLTRTTLRNIVGEMELDATLASRDAINNRMREV